MAASLSETESPLVCAQSMVIGVFPGQVVAFGVGLPISLIREYGGRQFEDNFSLTPRGI